MQNKNPNQESKEKILNDIRCLKEEIWETKAYISSDICQRCSDMYSKIVRLEQELQGLQRKISNDNSQN